MKSEAELETKSANGKELNWGNGLESMMDSHSVPKKGKLRAD